MRNIAIALVSVTLSASVFAGDYEAFATPTVGTAKTRAEVQAELQQARKDGSMKVFSSTYNPGPGFVSTKSRAQVRGELQQSIDSGEFEVLNAAEYVSFVPRATVPAVAQTQLASVR
jgi:hypothetical protein